MRFNTSIYNLEILKSSRVPGKYLFCFLFHVVAISFKDGYVHKNHNTFIHCIKIISLILKKFKNHYPVDKKHVVNRPIVKHFNKKRIVYFFVCTRCYMFRLCLPRQHRLSVDRVYHTHTKLDLSCIFSQLDHRDGWMLGSGMGVLA